jgi:hypothetical protein
MRSILTTFLLLLWSFGSQAQSTGIENITANIFYSTIQAAVDSSMNGDTIVVGPGIYYEAVSFNGKNIVVSSHLIYSGDTSFISSTIIDGSNLGTCFTFNNGEDSTAILNGFTLRKSAANSSLDADGIYCNLSGPTITNIKLGEMDYCCNPAIRLLSSNVNIEGLISNNRDNHASVIYADSSNLNLNKCSFFNNNALAYLYNGTTKIKNSEFQYNGGETFISCFGNSLFVDSCYFYWNNGCGWCYMFSMYNNISTHISNSHFIQCMDALLYAVEGEVHMENVIVENGHSDMNFISLTGVDFLAKNIMLQNNRTIDYPYVLDLDNCSSRIFNSTIIDNQSDSEWNSGIGVFEGTAHIVNCILDDNYADGMTCDGKVYNSLIATSNTYVSHSLVNQLYPSGNPTLLDGNLFLEDPGFEMNWRMEYYPYYRALRNQQAKLALNSPCIDAGTSIYVFNGDTLLNLDSANYSGSAPDLGYIEKGFTPIYDHDLGIQSITFHSTDSLVLVNDTLAIEIYNGGSQLVSSFQLNIELDSTPGTYTINELIPPNESRIIHKVAPFPIDPNQHYYCKSWLVYPNDSNTVNDTLGLSIKSGGIIEEVPSYQNFETNDGGWIPGGENSTWTHQFGFYYDWLGYQQGYLGSANTNHWISAPNWIHCWQHLSWLESPLYNVANHDSILVAFNLFIDEGGSNRGLALQYQFAEDSSWTYLGEYGDPNDWYNGYHNELDSFGIHTGAWVPAYGGYQLLNCTSNLEIPPGENYLKFRFVLHQGHSNGLYWFDDFKVFDFPLASQSILIQQGWNYVSGYIVPVIPAISKLTSSIDTNLIIVKNQIGEVYWPDFNIDQFHNWNHMEGYYLKSTVNDTLIIEGIQVEPENSSLLLPQGWSLIPYLRTSSGLITQQLSTIANDIIIIKNMDGLVYWPQYGVQLFNDMVPGQSYLLKTIQATTLTYPAN